jgi:anti-sigma factor RsiW
MKHPSRESWVPFLFGEATPEARQELEAHLRQCPECAKEIARWRQSLSLLDRWQLPRERAWHLQWFPVVKWGLAAMIVLGLGFASGRLSSPRAADLTAMRAGLAAELQQRLRTDLAADFQAALGLARTQITNEFQGQLATGMEKAAAVAVGASSRETQRLLDGVLQLEQTARDSDRQNTLALYQQLRQHVAEDYLSLRKDLETVASLTDTEIRGARQSIIQLAAFTQTADEKNKQ